MLAVTGLVKTYGARRALDGFDLTVQPGEIVGLVGRNGAGKTTFVEVVTGLVRRDAGQVRIAGLRDSRAARRLLGVAPQEQALYLPATVREHLRLFGALAGLYRGRLRAAIDTTAEELQLTDVLDRPVGLLSGGQRRRAQAACALLPSPAVGLPTEIQVGFVGGVPARLAERGRVVADVLHVNSFDPAATLATLLSAGHQPVSVDIIRPGLDDLYRAINTEAIRHAA